MEWIEKWWPMIIAVIGFIVWLIRLEAKVNSNNNMYEQHRVVCKEDKTQERIIDDKNLSRIEGAIDKLYDLLRGTQSTLDQIMGWKDSINFTKNKED